MFLTDNKRLLNKEEDLTPGSIKFLREQIAEETLRKAAPALLQALEDMHNQECGRYELKSCGHNYVCVCVGDKARAAIAAARGE